MKNLELAEIFYKMADCLEIQGVEWKPRAYRATAMRLETMPEDIQEWYQKNRLHEVSDIGKNMSEKISEYLETGHIRRYEELRREIPGNLLNLLNVSGLGPRKVKQLYDELGIDSLEKLESAANQGKISRLNGFGKKSEAEILNSLQFLTQKTNRIRLDIAQKEAATVINFLEKLEEDNLQKIAVAGSLRRQKETIGDIDILAMAKNPSQLMERFCSMAHIQTVLAQGETKSSIVLGSGLQIDLRVVPEESWGAAFLYFTGNKAHNIVLRSLAIAHGYKLNEYGLWSGQKLIAGATEADVYKKLGLDFIEPELRRDKGEVEAAKDHHLPDLVQIQDIKGDLHVHTDWSDGRKSLEVMVKAASALRYEYIAICDHSATSAIANGLGETRLKAQIKEIQQIQERYPNMKILCGSEVDIRKDGRLDFSDEMLKQLDIVIGSIHQRYSQNETEMTNRILRAFENPYLTIFAHPTGRLVNERPPYKADWKMIMKAAKEQGIILEINASPMRLDLNDRLIEMALAYEIPLIINTDAHHPDNFLNMTYGVAQARRAGATKSHVMNTKSLTDFLQILKNRKS